MMNFAAMLILLLSSVLSFLLLFAALLLLLRRAASRPRAAMRESPKPPANLPDDSFCSSSNPRLPAKRPDWRFLVHRRRHPRSTVLRRPTPLPAVPPQPSPVLTTDGKPRSDWAYFNADLGDLKDPSESLSLPRRA